MKYEVGKAYIHDGSAECPLPHGSAATLIMYDGDYRYYTKASCLDWTTVLCFVPTYIPPQPVERWAVYDHDGHFFSSHPDKFTAGTVAAQRSGRRVILMREVTE